MKVMLELWGFKREVEVAQESYFIRMPVMGFPGVHSIEFENVAPGEYRFFKAITVEEFRKMCGMERTELRLVKDGEENRG